MLIDLLKPVTIERAEAVSKKLRSIETEPTTGILPAVKDPTVFRAPASPVPGMVVDFKVKYTAQRNMPIQPDRLRENPELRQDPRMRPDASEGANPNDATYWRNGNLTSREQEEVRRVLQREQWTTREITFVLSRFTQAALLFTIDYHRKRVLGSRDHISALQSEMSQLLNRLALSREELSAFIALNNHDRTWIARLMASRATAPQETANQNAIESNQRKLDATENRLAERDLIKAQDQRIEDARKNLAAYATAHAYQVFKKIG
ncbi:MAG: hypothetical protein RIQ81_1345 [Pseudomonadota bacterium]